MRGREALEAKVWSKTHPDYRSDASGVRKILLLNQENQMTELVPLSEISIARLRELHEPYEENPHDSGVYFVGGKKYTSLHNATRESRRKNLPILDESGNVIEGRLIEGTVSPKRRQQYQERLAAYEAQQRAKKKNPAGRIQEALYVATRGMRGPEHLTDLARHEELRGMHYGRIESAARELARKGYIEFDGAVVRPADPRPNPDMHPGQTGWEVEVSGRETGFVYPTKQEAERKADEFRQFYGSGAPVFVRRSYQTYENNPADVARRSNPSSRDTWRGHRYGTVLGQPGFDKKEVVETAEYLADTMGIDERAAGSAALNMAALEAGHRIDADERGSRLTAEMLLRSLDRKIDGSDGVEAIRDDDGDVVAEYANTGDTYNATVGYDYTEDKFFLGSWGDWVENYEREKEKEALEEAIESPTIYLDNMDDEEGMVNVYMKGPHACRAAKHHQSVGGAHWECSGEDLAYASVVNHADLVEELEGEGYEVNTDEYWEPEED